MKNSALPIVDQWEKKKSCLFKLISYTVLWLTSSETRFTELPIIFMWQSSPTVYKSAHGL